MHNLISSMHRVPDRVCDLGCLQLRHLREELQRDIHSASAASGTSAAMGAQDTLHNSDARSLGQVLCMSQQAAPGGLSRVDSASSGISAYSVDGLAESWEGIMQDSTAATLQRKPLMLKGPSQLHENVEQSRLMTDHGAAAEPGNAGLAQSSHLNSEAVSSTAAAAGDNSCPVPAQKEGVLSVWSSQKLSPHTPLQDQDPGAAPSGHSAAAPSPAFGAALLAHPEAHGAMPHASPASAAGSSELWDAVSPAVWGEKPSACMLSIDSLLHCFSDSDEEGELARLEAKYSIYL